MSLKQWAPVVLVIGASYLLQPPAQGGLSQSADDGHVETVAAVGEATGPYRTVVLDVTGMT
jgi:hypothetical protein